MHILFYYFNVHVQVLQDLVGERHGDAEIKQASCYVLRVFALNRQLVIIMIIMMIMILCVMFEQTSYCSCVLVLSMYSNS